MTPTVGRMLWYRPGRNEGLSVMLGQPLAVTLAAVLPDGRVNIGGYEANGAPFRRTSVVLVQVSEVPPIDNAGITGYAEWPERAQPETTLKLPKKRAA